MTINDRQFNIGSGRPVARVEYCLIKCRTCKGESLIAAVVQALAIATAVLASTAGYGQTSGAYPTRPVRVIVGFTAGGPTDVIARLVAQKLSEGFDQNFYVDNVPGAGGNIAAAQAARVPADGYTLHVVSTGFIVNPSLYTRSVNYDPVKDFAPISILAASPNIISLNPNLPAHTPKELIALVKANPGKYNYAHPGTGSTPHLNGELFKLTFGLDLATIPFNGTAQLITSVISGDTPIAFTSLPSAMPLIRDGKLRALVVLSRMRVESLPDVPGTEETGIAGLEGDTVSGIVAPAGTPQPIIARLNAEIKKAAATPDVSAKLAALGFGAVASDPDEFGARILVEITKWAKVINEAKIKID
jgi:tripartite-type tricarboxylate transporter receptor subunit TctC